MQSKFVSSGKHFHQSSLGIALTLCALSVISCQRADKAKTSGDPSSTGATGALQAQQHGNIFLKLHGSNTIGAKMGPALARAYLQHLGADTVIQEKGATAEEIYVRGRFPQGEKTFEIWSYGSNTGFDDLAWGKCDVGMSSKPIDNQNVQRLAALGNMRAAENEHIIGLDGIAILVNPGNPLLDLDLSQVAAVFSGRVKDWKDLPGGYHGPITFYTRDKNSGTYEVFSHSVLGTDPMGETGVVCESNDAISKAVAANPLGIGYAPAGALEGVKCLKLHSGVGAALLPSKTNIVSEDYLLSRRLFLYTAAVPSNPDVKPFLEFAQTVEGQTEVEHTGFVAQIIRLVKPESLAKAPPRYKSEVKGALRLAVDFRFHPGSSELDNKARRDLGRVAEFLDAEDLRACRIKLFGFCDAMGNPEHNLDLSRKRAKIAGDALHEEYGMSAATVVGMGSALPIASNDNETGREKNRRIEVWVQCASQVAMGDAAQ